MYLDYAELQAENHNAMTMKNWVEKLNVFYIFKVFFYKKFLKKISVGLMKTIERV